MQSLRRNPCGHVGTAGWDERNLVEENQPCGGAVVYKTRGGALGGCEGPGSDPAHQPAGHTPHGPSLPCAVIALAIQAESTKRKQGWKGN